MASMLFGCLVVIGLVAPVLSVLLGVVFSASILDRALDALPLFSLLAVIAFITSIACKVLKRDPSRNLLVFSLRITVVAGIVEELWFRGPLLILFSSISDPWAVLVTLLFGLGFGLMHGYNPVSVKAYLNHEVTLTDVPEKDEQYTNVLNRIAKKEGWRVTEVTLLEGTDAVLSSKTKREISKSHETAVNELRSRVLTKKRYYVYITGVKGILYGLITVYTQSILPSIILHGAWNYYVLTGRIRQNDDSWLREWTK